MKYLILFTLVIQFYIAHSQGKIVPGDSLSKYAYTMLGLNGSPKTKFGTCFFVRNDEVLYLVTAKHVLYRCDSATNKVTSAFNSVVVSISQNPSKFINFIIPKRNETCIPIGRDTDLVLIEINSEWNDIINSVEGFLLPPFKELGDIEIFGQGIRIVSNSAYFEDPHRMNLPRNEFDIFYDSPSDDPSYLDTVHSFIKSNKVSVANKGFSGSPVFLQDYISKQWRLCGVLRRY